MDEESSLFIRGPCYDNVHQLIVEQGISNWTMSMPRDISFGSYLVLFSFSLTPSKYGSVHRLNFQLLCQLAAKLFNQLGFYPVEQTWVENLETYTKAAKMCCCCYYLSCSTNPLLFIVAIEALLSHLFLYFLTSKDENNSPRMNDFQNVAMLFFHRFTLVPYDDKNIDFIY